MKPQDIWKAAYNQLELQLERSTFDTWLRSAEFLEFTDDTFVVNAHNDYAQDMLQHRLYRNIRRVLSSICGYNVNVRFETNKSSTGEAAHEPKEHLINYDEEMPLFRLLAQQERMDEREQVETTWQEAVRQPQSPELPESELNPRLTFERFIVNNSNRVVYEASRAVAEYPATVYNPFLVYGDVGLGKTHLLQAIAHICRKRGLKVVYIPSEAFTNDLVNAIRGRTTAMFREKYRSADVLIVDDIQFISGKDTTQEEFFHTFNSLVNFNKQIVLGSDRHPREMATLEDRLRSRFQGGLVADVQPPELETRIAILQMWCYERKVDLPRKVIEMVAERAPNNVRELEGVFNQIVAQSRFGGMPLTLVHAEDTLERYTRPREHITVNQVMSFTAEHHGLRIEDLTGKQRAGRINRARQIGMYLARELTGMSFPQIGAAFGGRSHTTVLHGYNKIAQGMEYDQALSLSVKQLQDAILKGTTREAV